MSDSHRRIVQPLLVCGCLLAVVGCRQEPTTVKGRVTLDGQALAMKKGMRGTVVFQPTHESGRTLNGMIDSTGTYELAAGASTDVSPDVYWVTVSVIEILPADDKHAEPRGRRITPASYASATDSGFRIQVGPGPNTVNLDLRSEKDEPPAVEDVDAEKVSVREMLGDPPKAAANAVAPANASIEDAAIATE